MLTVQQAQDAAVCYDHHLVMFLPSMASPSKPDEDSLFTFDLKFSFLEKADSEGTVDISVPGQRFTVKVADEFLFSELLDQFLYLFFILLFDLGPRLPLKGFWDILWGW